jgi:glucose-6-phosphate isomerase
MNIAYTNLDETKAFAGLKQLGPEAEKLSAFLTAENVARCETPAGGGLTLNYAARGAGEELLSLLRQLAGEQQLIEKYRALAGGEIMNTGEGRMVLHHLCRGELAGPVRRDGRDIGRFYEEQKNRFYSFAEKVRRGDITGSTGKPFTAAVQIGIGGSDLGPRALYLALKNWAAAEGREKLRARFISNVDPDDANEVIHGLDFESTLFILVSKSGTTQETLTNRAFVVEKMKQSGIQGLVPERHMVAVTSETSPLADSPDYLDSFYIDDYIGGRYSAASAVGGVILSLAFGKEVFQEILSGAHEADRNALEEELTRNSAMLDACLGVYERNFRGMPTTAVLPYSQALHRFPAHLQQLDMESNGKRVNRFGKPVAYATGPVVFGEPGTNGQHSFYQLLHQGTDIVPLQFIGFKENQTGFDLEEGGATSRQKLNANLAAQVVAFAKGRENENLNKQFPGGRPSSLLYGKKLTPKALGALLAHFENKVMFQGFIWNINSFDQEGVQLGKILTKQIVEGTTEDPALDAYVQLLE